MIVTLDTARLRTIEQVAAFMQGTDSVGFSPPPESERYDQSPGTSRACAESEDATGGSKTRGRRAHPVKGLSEELARY